MIVDCQNFNFSTQLSHQRICVANKALGGNVIQRILSYSLYLQGSSKALIAKNINIPSDTTKSLIKRIHSDGITAFCDRRNKVNPVVKPETEQENLYSISAEGDFVNIYVSRQGKPIVVPTKNTLQLKTVLFTLADSGLISNQDVSNILKYSPNHIQHLRKKMQEEDAYALIDKRQGQNQDYRFTEDVKSELILQFILDISKEKKVSGMSLACNLRERVNLDLSPRSIRNHIDKLGLGKIKKQVLDCLNEVKKKLFSVLKNTATPAALEQVNNTTNRVFKPRHSQRSQVRVLLQSSYSVSFIARTLRCHRQTVINWNGRFVAGESIVDKPRSGRPARIPLEAKIRLTAFYCQHNPLPGCSRWSIRWVEKYLDNHPDIIQFPMSRSSIHRCLISHYLKPYRWKYFLHISDPYFFEKMEKIISLYLNPPKYLFCLDECTGLQVLERIAPALYAQGDKPELREFEYKRHGTVSVFSILQVSNGKVFTDCIEDHTTITIIQSLEKHIAMYDPSETLHYILDNYSSHSTEEFCQKIAKLSGVETPKLKTVIERKEWLESRGKRIVFHFLPFHGSWLNQIEIWFGILQQKALKDESFSSVTACAEAVLNFTDTYNIEFSHPFKWSYNGDGLHEKVVSRLTKWIESESTEFSFKFFAKQLHLIKNLINNYWNKVKKITWLNLHKCIVGKSKFCEDIIRKINADNFKDIKGSKDDSKAQVEEKINLKIKETKERLMVLFSELKNQLIEKLTVT